MLRETDEHDTPGIPRPDLAAYRTLVRREIPGHRTYRWNARVDGAVVGFQPHSALAIYRLDLA